MSGGRLICLFLLAFLLGTLYFLNPSKEQHINTLKVKFDNEYEMRHGNDDAFGSRFVYHNYIFFSTTTQVPDDNQENTTTGILGFVF
jgi:hypothetical protein